MLRRATPAAAACSIVASRAQVVALSSLSSIVVFVLCDDGITNASDCPAAAACSTGAGVALVAVLSLLASRRHCDLRRPQPQRVPPVLVARRLLPSRSHRLLLSLCYVTTASLVRVIAPQLQRVPLV